MSVFARRSVGFGSVLLIVCGIVVIVQPNFVTRLFAPKETSLNIPDVQVAFTGGSPVAPGFASLTSATSSASKTLTSPLMGPRTPPPGYLEYRNTKYRFSLFYPNILTVKSYDEGDGATTIAFQDIKTAQGFQVFVMPYSARQVSTERFHKDEPSGVMKGPKNVSIDGVAATSFYGSNEMLGDTAEIWFIHDGYLFETTAPKPLASWFSQIMTTWSFL